ncbi:MAG: pyridoxal phosphate-dependent aminotransferase [Acidimicrobiales bacterium]|nr:pyridoxal phosphate-dependent aminotransferase [Acidimicrobiales bacterium]
MTRRPFLASRLQGFGTTIFAEMSALAAQTGALNLGQGFPDSDGPDEVKQVAIDSIFAGVNQYPPGPGTMDLRRAIGEHQKRFYGIDLDPTDEVLVTAGATEALAASYLGLCEVGDEVVAFDPTYDSYAAGISMAGAVLKPVPLLPQDDGSFGFDDEELRRAFSPKTRLLMLNTPHNPTGKVFNRSELQLLAELCQEHDVIAVVDEVYEHMVFSGTHVPLATLPGMAERTISIGSAGKMFSFTGWKVGWATGPAPIVSAIRTAKQFLTFVNGAPFQPAVAVGLRLGDDYFATLGQQMADKKDLLCDKLDQAGFTVLEPEGTYFVTADISPVTAKKSVEFCLALPEEAGVVAVPCSVFYQDDRLGERHIRFCFAKSDAFLAEAGERLISAYG